MPLLRPNYARTTGSGPMRRLRCKTACLLKKSLSLDPRNGFWVSGRQPLPYRIMEGFLVIQAQSREAPLIGYERGHFYLPITLANWQAASVCHDKFMARSRSPQVA